MNPSATSKEKILEVSHQMMLDKGLSAINMRTVAQECGVAVGCIYNYFPSKADLMSSTIEMVWRNIFHMSKEDMKFDSFSECLVWLFDRIQTSSQKYPKFFAIHAIGFAADEKSTGKQMMEHYLTHLKVEMTEILIHDKNVRKGIFDDVLTPAVYVDYVLTLLMTMLMEDQRDPKAFIRLIENSIY